MNARKVNYKAGSWNKFLRENDTESIYSELLRLLRFHSMVTPQQRLVSIKGGARTVDSISYTDYSDLVQDLYLRLFHKNRFEYYLDAQMTDEEISSEIYGIEIRNMMMEDLRKRSPEAYRIARRISNTLQSSRRFKLLNHSKIRTSEKLYGLSSWEERRPNINSDELVEKVKQVPYVRRDFRKVGCTGDVDLIISNKKLEDLIENILSVVGNPITVKDMRKLVMSRLDLIVFSAVYISDSTKMDEGDEQQDMQIPCSKDNPEQRLLLNELEANAADSSVDKFLSILNKDVRGKDRQYRNMLSVVWYCYFSPETSSLTQMQIANMMGVSDSLVSDYRKRIERSLRKLEIENIRPAIAFSESLKLAISAVIH